MNVKELRSAVTGQYLHNNWISCDSENLLKCCYWRNNYENHFTHWMRLTTP